MCSKIKDLTNVRFGRLIAKRPNGFNKWRNAIWTCLCDCGKSKDVVSGKLISGKTTSCGCYANDLHINQLTRHGLTSNGKKPRTFIIWNGIKDRCYNPKNNNYHRYGGRGIKMHEEWLCFEKFHEWSISNGFAESLTIDRIDNDGDYTPDNCRWVSRELNCRLQSRYTLLTVNGVTLPLGTFASAIKVGRHTLRAYYNKNGKAQTEAYIQSLLPIESEGKGQQYFVNKFLNINNQ